jgi:hypothetical protein
MVLIFGTLSKVVVAKGFTALFRAVVLPALAAFW